MNKVVKGTIAAASAVALFGGGAGSLAYWQASASTDALTLELGHVQLFDNRADYTLNGEAVELDTLISYDNRMVPGDVVTYQHTFGIDVALAADAVLAVSELDFGNTPTPVLDVIETNLSVAPIESDTDSLIFSYTNTQRSYNVTGRGAVTVTISITLPAGVEDPDVMVSAIFLQALPVTLTQVAEPLPVALG